VKTRVTLTLTVTLDNDPGFDPKPNPSCANKVATPTLDCCPVFAVQTSAWSW